MLQPQKRRIAPLQGAAGDEPPIIEMDEGGMLVSFVEPNPMNADYADILGHWTMFVPPRVGETVVLQPAFRANWQRFKVIEVLHFMPGRAEGNAPCDSAVTVVVTRYHAQDEVERLMGFLTRRLNSGSTRPPTDDQRPTHNDTGPPAG